MTRGPRTQADDVVDGVIEEVRRSQQLSDSVTLDAGTALLETGLALDSVAVLELLLAVEQRFGRRIEEHEVTIDNLRTVGALARLMAGKLGSHPSGDV